MAIVTLVKNPFDPVGSREIVSVRDNLCVSDMIEQMLPDVQEYYRIACAVDGQVVSDYSIIPAEQSSVALIVVPQGGGGGKDIFKAVALLALVVGAPYLLSAVGIGAFNAAGAFTIGGSTAWGGMAVGATVISGALILNAVLPTQAASQVSGQTQSATYGWDVQNNPVQEGGVLPELYGKCKIVPPLIGKYVETDSSGNQTINLLYALAGHEVNGIDQVRINGTDHSAYNYCNIEYRKGSNALSEQPCMQAFGSTRTDVPVNQQLTNAITYITKTTGGNAFTGLGIGIVFPNGLCHMNSDGSIGSNTVYLKIQYMVTGGSTWTTINQSTTVPATSSATGYWSGGYWANDGNDGSVWVELEVGSSGSTDHTEGDYCTIPESIWAASAYASFYGRPISQWHWLVSTKTVAAYTNQTSTITITAAQTSALRQTYYIYGLTAGTTYDIQVALMGTLSTDISYINNVYWEYYEEILEDNFFYPNTALMAIRSFATSQLNGSLPSVDLWCERSYIYVWNPSTSAYEAKPASNPAWACYDLVHQCRRLLNTDSTYTYKVRGASADLIIYADFASWANFCDDTTNGKPQYTCNIYFDQPYTLQKALDIVGLLGRGVVIRKGNKFSCAVERPEQTPVQRFVFNSGNIQQDSFTEEWLPMDSRANAIEVKYRDKDDYYNDKTIQLFQSDFDTSPAEIKKTSINYIGCVDQAMAMYYAKFLLNCNRYLTLTSSWVADIDAIACVPGEIIEVQNDVPQWGYGGRLLAGCSATSLLLDQPVVMTAGTTYHVIVYHQSDDLREEVEVVNSGTASNTIALSTVLSRAPSESSKFIFGEVNKVGKLFRMIKLTRAGDLRRKITAIEFVNEVFVDGATITPFNPSDLPTALTPPTPTSISLTLIWKLDISNRRWKSYVRLSIVYDSAKASVPITTYRIYVHASDGNTSSTPMKGAYELIFDSKYVLYDYEAAGFNGKTIYANACLVNQLNLVGAQCSSPGVLYVDTTVNPVVPSQVSVDQSKGTYGYDYYDTNYTVYLKWEPSGWALTNNLYAPITSWNNGNNWYEIDHYTVCAGWVAAQGNIPAISDLVFYNTPDIGQIYDSSGNLITDATKLDAACRAACSLTCPNMGYSPKWIAWTVVPVTKSGGLCKLDTTLASYGLDWGWVQVASNPSGGGGTLVDITQTLVTNGEMIYTMQGASLFLAEMQWDYPLQSPDIDGFAIIYRAQPYWWMWELKTDITASEISLANIIDALDFTTGGGTDAATDFCNRYAEWNTGGKIPAFYFLIADSVNSEVIKVDMGTLAVTRGVEGTTAQAFGAGAVLSYAPSEYIDSFYFVQNTHQRSVVFSPTLQVDFALHATIVAWRSISTTPGYIRTPYAYWQYIQQR